LEEKEQKVVLTHSDIQNIRDFFTHFKIQLIPELDEVMQRWEKKKDAVTIGDQNDFKVALCSALLQSDHKMFKDELFKNIISNSEKIVYEATFKREFENQLTTEEKK
jgi:hypothetical protein